MAKEKTYIQNTHERLASYESVEGERIEIIHRSRTPKELQTVIYADRGIIAEYNNRGMPFHDLERFSEKLEELAEQGVSAEELVIESENYRNYLREQRWVADPNDDSTYSIYWDDYVGGIR